MAMWEGEAPGEEAQKTQMRVGGGVVVGILLVDRLMKGRRDGWYGREEGCR